MRFHVLVKDLETILEDHDVSETSLSNSVLPISNLIRAGLGSFAASHRDIFTFARWQHLVCCAGNIQHHRNNLGQIQLNQQLVILKCFLSQLGFERDRKNADLNGLLVSASSSPTPIFPLGRMDPWQQRECGCRAKGRGCK